MIKRRLIAIAGPALAAVFFVLAMRLLWQELQAMDWDDFKAGLTSVPVLYLLIAAFLIALNYGLLITYDLLALRYICRSLPLRRVALVSFLGFSLGNNLGSILAGAPIRFRFYSRWGIKPHQIAALMSALGLTFWSGLWFLGGLVLVLTPFEFPDVIELAGGNQVTIPVRTRTLGFILLGLALSYTAICYFWRKPWPIGRLHLLPPDLSLMAVQASCAAVDLLISATALYLVLPPDAPVSFPVVLAAYLMAIAVSLISQVPGGLGVLELILCALLKDMVGDSIYASVLIFRILYYVLPLVFGMITLVSHEIYGGTVEARRARQG